MPYIGFQSNPVGGGGACIPNPALIPFTLTYSFTLPGDLPAYSSSLDPDDLAYAVVGILRLYNSICDTYSFKFSVASWGPQIVSGTSFPASLTYDIELTDFATFDSANFHFELTRLIDSLILTIEIDNPIFTLREQFEGGATSVNNGWWEFRTVSLEAASPWTVADIMASNFPVPGTADLIEYSNPTNIQPPNDTSGPSWGFSTLPNKITFVEHFNPYQNG